MAGRTKRLGLNRFGGAEAGSIVDDGQKHTSLDRDTIDAAFVQTEKHDHKYRPLISAAVATPTAIVATGGRLRGGQTLYYRVAMVESDGTEGVAGPEISVALPALLVPPGPLATDMNETLPDPTGALPPGLYAYALTALRGDEQTSLGPALQISVPLGQGGVRLALPPFGDADAVRLWRMHDSAAGYTAVAVIPEGTTTFHDDGSVPADPCACDPGNLPPTQNVGASNYAVEITLPPGVTPAAGWRIYRSTTSARYLTSSLVHLVTELNDEDDLDSGVVKSWVDVGDPLQLGVPQDSLVALRFQPYTFDSAAGALPDPTGYPELYPLMFEGVLHVLIGGAWKVVGAGGGGGGGGASAVLTSPNGKRWIQTVTDAGVSTMVETQMPGPSTPPQNVTVS